MENAKKFFDEAIRTEEAKAIFDSFEKPANENEAVKIYAEVAAKLGVDLSADEIKAYFAEKTPCAEVDDEELAQLSGGNRFEKCQTSYIDRENCWWNDGCDYVFERYTLYECKNINLGHESVF